MEKRLGRRGRGRGTTKELRKERYIGVLDRRKVEHCCKWGSTSNPSGVHWGSRKKSALDLKHEIRSESSPGGGGGGGVGGGDSQRPFEVGRPYSCDAKRRREKCADHRLVPLSCSRTPKSATVYENLMRTEFLAA